VALQLPEAENSPRLTERYARIDLVTMTWLPQSKSFWWCAN